MVTITIDLTQVTDIEGEGEDYPVNVKLKGGDGGIMRLDRGRMYAKDTDANLMVVFEINIQRLDATADAIRKELIRRRLWGGVDA